MKLTVTAAPKPGDTLDLRVSSSEKTVDLTVIAPPNVWDDDQRNRVLVTLTGIPKELLRKALA